MLGVIVAASSGALSATKFFGNKIIAKLHCRPDELVRSMSLTTILLPVLKGRFFVTRFVTRRVGWRFSAVFGEFSSGS